MAEGKVWLVGAGPGDPGLLTLKGARALAHCDALVYDYLVSAAIVALASPACEKIFVGKKPGSHTITQDEITALLIRLGSQGRRIVRLKGGDPFVFARGGEEAQALRAAGIPFEIVPGITSALAVPAYAGIPVTYRGRSTSFAVATGHENHVQGHSTLDFGKLANPRQTLVFLMAMTNLALIVDQLRGHGLPGTTPVAIVREGTTPAQETLVGTLDSIVAQVAQTGFAAPAVVVVGDVVAQRESIRWFDTGPLFGKRVLVTRPAAQAEAFAAQLWEHGAHPIVAPAIELGPPDDPARVDTAVAAVRSYDWIVLTSQNAVAALFERLAAAGRDARALGDTQVAAIGPKTADVLRDHGVRADFLPETFVNEAIAEGLLARTAPGERVLLFRAQEARSVLPQTLRAAGRLVDDVAAYRTRSIVDPDLPAKAQDADILTFTSSSSVTGFVANVPDAVAVCAGRLVACIGPVTAATAREAGLRVDVVAESSTVEGLLASLSRSVSV